MKPCLQGNRRRLKKSEMAGYDSSVYSGTLAISGSATIGVTDTGIEYKNG